MPKVLLPPEMPLTLHVTLALLALLTAAVNACALPNKIEALVGVTLTVILAGTGGGLAATDPAPPAAQACAQIAAASAAIRAKRAKTRLSDGAGGRKPVEARYEIFRMHRPVAGEWPAKGLHRVVARNRALLPG